MSSLGLLVFGLGLFTTFELRRMNLPVLAIGIRRGRSSASSPVVDPTSASPRD